ncbi:MAG: hypothetical protein JW827_08995 [Spirochaetes bacterium]|nr:hypothetical protein [Spirochaetota bacterium]
MDVKGTALASLPIFIKKEFDIDGVHKWLNSLPEKARKVFSQPIMPGGWYPLTDTLVEGTIKMVKVLYLGDQKGALEAGRYSAEYALKGIYKLFVKIGSVEYLIEKASVIMPTYYRPSRMEIVEKEKNRCLMRIIEFPEMHEILELRIMGWIEKAMEISGAKNIKIQVIQSLLKKDPVTDFLITWD